MALFDRNRWYSEFTRLYLLKIDSGLDPREAFKQMQRMGYDQTHTSMRKHAVSYKVTGRAIREVKGKRNRGKIVKLSAIKSYV